MIKRKLTMRPNTLVLLCCSLLFLLVLSTACGKVESPASKETASASPGPAQSPAQEMVSSASVVRVTPSGVQVAAGSTGEASVKLTITNGYHVNANPPSMPELIPTLLTVEPGEGLTAGKPVYPSSITKKFPFAEKPLAVYEGEATIKLPLTATSAATKGAHTLRAKLRVQACDDQACYPPRTIETSIPVTVN